MAQPPETNTPNQEYPEASDQASFNDAAPEQPLHTDNESISRETNHATKSDASSPNIIINIPPQEENKSLLFEAQRANVIAKRGLYINAILSCFTLVALALTWRSINISQEALKDSRKNDSLNYIRDTIMERRNRESLELAKQSFESTQNSFDTEKQGYLQITIPDFPNASVGKPIGLTVLLNNLGSYPVHVIKNGYSLSVGKQIPRSQLKLETVSVDVAKEYPIKSKAYGDTLTIEDARKLLSGEYSIFERGKYIYKSANNKKCEFACVVKLTMTSETTFRVEQLESRNTILNSLFR